MDERKMLALCKAARVLIRFVVPVAMQNDVSAVTLGRVHLHQRRHHRHYDLRHNPVALSMIGDSLRMIAGTRRNYAALFLMQAQRQNFVERAALLERAGTLEILELQVDRLPAQFRDARRQGAWRKIDST